MTPKPTPGNPMDDWTIEKLECEMDYPSSVERLVEQLNAHKELISALNSVMIEFNKHGAIELTKDLVSARNLYYIVQNALGRAVEGK